MANKRVRLFSVLALVIIFISALFSIYISKERGGRKSLEFEKILLKPYIHNLIVDEEIRGKATLSADIYGFKFFVNLPREPEILEGGRSLVYLPSLEVGDYILSFGTRNIYLKVDGLVRGCNLESDKVSTQCYVNFYVKDFIKDFNINRVLGEILEKKESDPNLAVSCHILVHEIGRVYVYKFGSIDEENNKILRVCDNAFIHGEEEGVAVGFDKEKLENYFSSICSSSELLKLVGNCNHGLGHLAYWHEGDFTEGMKYCGLLENENDVINCGDGVAMSFSEDYVNLKLHGGSRNQIPPLVNNPFDLCDGLSLNLLKGCYSNINFLFDKDGYDQLKRGCDLLDSEFHEYCYISLGRLLGFFYDKDFAMKSCISKLEESATTRCAAQFISWVYFMRFGNTDYTEDFCRYYSRKALPVTICEELRRRAKDFTP